MKDDITRRATVHTESRIALQSLKNTKKSQLSHWKNQEDCNSTGEKQPDNHIHLGKSPFRNLWERVSRQTSEGCRRKRWYIHQRNPQKWNSTRREKSEHRQVAKPMGSHYERVNNETVHPSHQGHTDQQDQTNTKLQGNSNSSRQNQGIPAPFQNNRASRMPLQCREPNGGSPTIWLHQNTGEREKLTSNISNQDKGPVNKCNIVKNTQKTFYSVRRSNRFWETMNLLTPLTTKKNIQILPQVLIHLHTKTECKSHTISQFTNMEY